MSRRLRTALLALFAMVACVPTNPQSSSTPEPSPSPELGTVLDASEVVYAHLHKLQELADAHGGRATGSVGYRQALAYVEEQLQKAGYRTEVSSAPALADDKSTATLEADGNDVAATVISGAPGTPAGGVTGPLRVVSKLGCAPTDYPADVAGGIAVIPRGECRYETKARLAAAAGAVGMIVTNHEGEGKLDGELVTVPGPLPSLGVTYEVGERLRGLAGKSATIQLTADYATRDVLNLIATWPEQTDREVIVGAHLDSVPDGPGLNDNGSGVAMALYLAQEFAAADAASGLTFAFWDAEEIGLLGSKAYVSGREVADLEHIDAYINLDMVASPNGVIGLYGDDTPRAEFEQAFSELGTEHIGVDLGDSSDHAVFARVGVPVAGLFSGADGELTSSEALQFGGEAGEPYDSCYHEACDTLSTLDTDKVWERVDAFAAVAVLAISNIEDER